MRPRHQYQAKSSHWLGSSFAAIAMVGTMTVPAMVCPARAATLDGWTYDPAQRQLTVTLPTGITPDYFLLAQPARIVLTLPATTLGEAPRERQYEGAVRSIRIAEAPGETRVVLELAPNTLLDPRHAELTATDVGSGRTEWTLRPLLQADAAATAAVETTNPNPASVPEAGAIASPAPDPSTGATTSAAASSPPAPFPPLEDDPPATAATSAALARAALQAIPENPTDLPGVRTDAAALAEEPDEGTSNDLPETLPLDPLAARRDEQPVVSVPSLTEADASPPPVSAPPLDTVPEVPTTASPGEAIAPPPAAIAPPDSADGTVATSPVAVSPPDDDAIATPPSSPPASDPAPAAAAAVPTAPRSPVPNPPPLPENPPPEPPVVEADPPAPELPIEPSRLPAADQSVAATDARDRIPPPPEAESSTVTPPFLTGTGAVPSVETPSIPPPPPLPAHTDTVPFGEPLPQGKTVEDGTSNAAEGIPVGTRLPLQYVGDAPLQLTQRDPWYEVLIVAEEVTHPVTQERLLAAGTPIMGRFEGFDESGRRFVTQAILVGDDRRPLLAESDWLLGTRQPQNGNLLMNSGVGAVAATVLTGFSGVGLLGGAALGAASTWAQSPQLVTIQPGQVIEVEVVTEILPFNDAPVLPQR